MNNETPNNKTDKSEFWLSLDQYNNDPAFAFRAESEFMSSPFANEDGKDGFARRDFLKLMGASIAMATTACVRRPIQHIIPYAQAPKELTPGVAAFYASTWYDGVEGYGTLVRTLEGRPVKMEGNPSHPMNKGALNSRGFAETLFLYDPDRLKGPTRNLQNATRTNKESIAGTWEQVDAKILEALGKGSVAILSATVPSPSSQAMISDFSRTYGNARWVQYDTMPVEAIVEAQRRSYGRAVLPRYKFENADFVVSIDADFIGTHISPVEYTNAWSERRKPGKGMSRTVSFDSAYSLTSMNADDRFKIKPSQQIDVVMGLIAQVVRASKGAASVPGGASGFISKYNDVASRLGFDEKLFAKTGDELWAARGKSLVLAGGLPGADAVEVQMAVNALNSLLGNDGKTIDHSGATVQTRQGNSAELATLIADMAAGKVKTLIIHNLNAVYALPSSAGFVAALAKVETVIYTGNMNDETGRYANYVVPNGSTLEAWGDYELQSGVYSIQQPTIRPLFDSRSFEESLFAWTKKAASAPASVKNAEAWYDYVRNTWRTVVQPKSSDRGLSFDDFWYKVLQTGVVVTGSRTGEGASRGFTGTLTQPKAVASEGYELALFAAPQIADGKYANVSWMQELPDPITKIVWDNYLMISLATARKEGLNEGDKVDLTVNGKTIRVPVHIQPGMHDQTLSLAIGYGRTHGGKVANGVGVNAFELASLVNGRMVFGGQATIKKTGERYRLVSTQDHHTMEGRQIVIETTNDALMKDPGAGIHRHHVFSIWPDHEYTKHKWGMAIDLNTCSGCSACVIACQAENNIPVVGKKYVLEGREMHWLRIDRYYKGTPENPEAVFQPMLCQHCGTAPCETVCPVLATVHSDEGLNEMVYNRCVGTRYCSNNCPYKVRRFNWFNFSKREAPLHMALNPDVTVRARGVMEKCSFCVHRIRHATSEAKRENGGKAPARIKDGTIQTACEQSCASGCIVFGDLNDPESRVSKLFAEQRSYSLLEELNTQPRVKYMARVRNAERPEVAHGAGHHAAAPKVEKKAAPKTDVAMNNGAPQ